MTTCISTLTERRKSIRRFSPTSIPLEAILATLEIACQAPSGANSQPWRFVVITDPPIKQRIRAVCESVEREFYSQVRGDLEDWLLSKGLTWKKPFLEEAPVLILVLSEKKAPYATQSVWLAIGYLLLALEERGLSSLTYTPSTASSILREARVPDEYALEAILPVGVSAEEKTKEPRLAVERVTHLNAWGSSFTLESS